MIIIRLMVCLYLVGTGIIASSQTDVKFRYLGNDFTYSTVTSFYQDKEGFIWVGTQNGLYRYNGHRMDFYGSSTDSTGLSNAYVRSITADDAGNIWTATLNGMNCYDKRTKSFTKYGTSSNPQGIEGYNQNHIRKATDGNLWLSTDSGVYVFDPEKRVALSHFMSGIPVRYSFEDQQGNIWFGSRELHLLNSRTNEVINFNEFLKRPGDAAIQRVVSLAQGDNGSIWAGTDLDGLFEIVPEPSGGLYRTHHFSHQPLDQTSLPGNSVLSLLRDHKDNLWVGTQNGGLCVFNSKDRSFINYSKGANTTVMSIWALYEDNDYRIWAGDYHWGISVYDPNDKQFISHDYRYGAPNTLSKSSVRSFDEDSQGKIIIGTDGGGVNIYDPITNEFEWLMHDPTNQNSLANNAVLFVTVDKEDNLWIGMWDGGLDYYDRKTRKFTHYTHDPNDPQSISTNRVFSIVKDKDNPSNLWLATHGSGIDYFDSEKGTFTRFQVGGEEYGSHTLGYDATGNLWLGTPGGLFKMTLAKKNKATFKKYTTKEGLSADFVLDTYVDSKGRFWVGGNSYGFSLYNPELDSFRSFGPPEGLVGNSATSFQEDDQGNLWVSTQKGLVRVEIDGNDHHNYTFRITTYFKEDGLPGDEFFGQSSLKSKNGHLYFGTVKTGFIQFLPERIKENTIIPKVHLTRFEVMNQPTNLLRKTRENKYEEIVLNHDQNIFTIEFAALNYTRPELNRYAYKLEGLEKDWHYAGHSNRAIYTNLSPGTYTFRARGSNNDGYWNVNPVTVKITITPPFYQTTWFRGLMMMLGLMIILMIIKAIKLRQEVRIRKESEYELNEARKKAEDANKAKSDFLANMSHEIRTPMNGIIGMAELILETDLNDQQKEYATIVMESADTLTTVINDILDYSKIEANMLELDFTEVNLSELVESVLASFSLKAAQKNIELLYEIQNAIPALIETDPVRVRQIITNLIGNAVKFTDAGEILIRVSLANPATENADTIKLHFSVKDTGIGIPEDKLDKIFESFSQVDTTTTRKYGGTGLGLAICQKLTHLLGGRIWVESTENEGSTFHFMIECGKCNSFKKSQPTDSAPISYEDVHFLIVDDNTTNCTILHNLLTSRGARVSVACDHQKALELTSEYVFTIILMDHQMPSVSGLDLAEMIASDEKNRSTDIILLSSIADTKIAEHKKRFISEAITKPIKRKDLFFVINKVLEKKKELRAAEPRKPLTTAMASEGIVLLAEDNHANQLVARHMCEQLNLQLELADDGEAAIKMAALKKYDVIFMDIQMPRIDGYKATQKIRHSDSINNRTPIIAMTAHAMNGDQEKCLRAGMDDFIAKPIKLASLRAKVTKWLKTEIS